MRCHSIFAINKSCDFTKTRLEKIPVSMEANKKKKMNITFYVICDASLTFFRIQNVYFHLDELADFQFR